MLARRTLHVYAGFDTVAFDFEGEIRLWDNLATMLPKRGILDRLINMRRREWQRLDMEARREIADFLLDAAHSPKKLPKTTTLPRLWKSCNRKSANLSGKCNNACSHFTASITTKSAATAHGCPKPSNKIRLTASCSNITASVPVPAQPQARSSA